MGNQLIAIGEALIDFIPNNIGCDFDEITEFAPKIGGAPANVCGAFSKLGGSSCMLTQLGDDLFGHKILRGLKAHGINTDYISLTDTANTALAFVSLDKKGGRKFSFYRKPSADMLYSSEKVREEYFDDVYALHFCSISLGDFPMKDAHVRAIELARKRGGLISFDPNLRFQLWDNRSLLKTTVLEFLPLADVVKISDEELEFITGETELQKALPKLFVGNVKLVLYTCGGEGAYAVNGKTSVFAPSSKVEVFDTTGAGDGFIGSFLWKMHQLGITSDRLSEMTSDQLAECLTFSHRFCGISVTKLGAIDSYPDAAAMNVRPISKTSSDNG